MTRNQFTVLIADRNPRVREFLGREFTSSGYRVLLAKDGRDVLRITNVDRLPDLLILDLDIPYPSGLTILKKLQARKPPLPIVVHTCLNELETNPLVHRAAGIWEKQVNNINGLKEIMVRIKENIIDYSIGDRIKSLLIIASNVLLRYKCLPIKNIEGKEVINWFLEALISEITLLSNVKKTDYNMEVKNLISSAEKAFIVGNAEEAVEFISTAISKATTQVLQLLSQLEL